MRCAGVTTMDPLAAATRTKWVRGSGLLLDDRYRLHEGTVHLTGIQSLVRVVRDRALLDRRRGLRTASFVSGYEGSPLAGYDLKLARRKEMLDEIGVAHLPRVNEEIAATSVMGSQLTAVTGTPTSDGVTGYWYGKAPGLDRATDALRHANLIGTAPTGGAVAFVGDDPAGKSSSLAGASEFALADLGIPTLFPADQQDVLDFGVHAAYLSLLTGLWSALKIVTAVADGAATVTVHPDRIAPSFGDLVPIHRPEAHLLGANLLKLERSLVSQRLPLAVEYARHNGLDRVVVSSAHDRVGIVAAGKTYLDVREALTKLGLGDDDGAARARRAVAEDRHDLAARLPARHRIRHWPGRADRRRGETPFSGKGDQVRPLRTPRPSAGAG